MYIGLITGDEKGEYIALSKSNELIHVHTLCEALFMTKHTMESEYDMFKLMD